MKPPQASSRARGKPSRTGSAARRAAAVELRGREARLRLALEAAHVGIYDWDIRRERITWSRWHEQLWGFKPGEFRGSYQEFAGRVHPEDLPRVNAEIQRCRDERARYTSEFRVVWPDGTERWILGSGEFSFGRDGAAVRMRGIVQDISDRKQLEVHLSASEMRYRALIEHSHDAILFFSPEGTVLYASPSTTEVMGYAVTELEGRNALDFVRPDYREAVGGWLADALRSPGVAVQASAYVRHQSGGWRFLEGYLTNLLHEPGVGAIVNNFRDRTTHHRIERQLRESEEKFSKAFRTNPAMVVITTMDGRHVDFNDDYAAFVGRSREQMLGRSATDLQILDADEWQRMIDLIDRAGGSVRNVEMPLRTSAGRQLQLLLSSDTITLGGVPHRLSTLLDITALNQTVSALRESEERFASIFKAAPGSLLLASMPDGKIVEVNETFSSLTGYSREEVLGRNTGEVGMWADPLAREAFLAMIARDGSVTNYEADLRHKSGAIRVGLASGQVISIRGRSYLLGSFFDITERKLADAAVRDLSRRLMEAQDDSRRELARELHDRVGQNLTALNLNLSILQSALPSAAEAQVTDRLDDSLKLVTETMDRVRNVMADLRPPVLDDYGLAAALRWHANLFSQRSGLSVKVESDEPAARWPPRVEAALFRVAEEAMTNVIRHSGAREIAITLFQAGHGFQLTIADDGRGFEPMSATAGAHWGLTSMRERADAVGGRFRIESAIGGGTKVIVDLPSAQ